MKVMMIVKANATTEAGVMPSEELLAAMGKFNEQMVKAGVMLEGAGLKPTSKGARVRFQGGKAVEVTDGPFAETKELIAGYWILQVKSLQEAIEWAKRCPAPHGPEQDGTLEIRPFYEMEDFGESEALRAHQRLQDELDKKR